MRGVWIVVLMLASGIPVSGQHSRDYGEIATINAESLAAGLGSFRLVRVGHLSASAAYSVDALDPTGEPVGVFDVRFPSKGVIAVDYLSASGDAVRIRTDEAAMTYEFEHEGGDSYTLHVPVCDETTLGKAPSPPTEEALAEYRRRVRECSSQMSITGTEKSLAQAGADNLRFTTLMGAVVREVEDAVERARQRESEGGGVGTGSLQGLGGQSEISPPCDPSHRECPVGGLHGFVATGFSFLGDGRDAVPTHLEKPIMGVWSARQNGVVPIVSVW